MNTFMGAGALGMTIDDFNGDNFDHSDLDFIHGGVFLSRKRVLDRLKQIQFHVIRLHGEQNSRRTLFITLLEHYRIGGQGASMPHKENFLSLDSNYKDAYGLPLLQMTYNFTDQDKALHKYLTEIYV